MYSYRWMKDGWNCGDIAMLLPYKYTYIFIIQNVCSHLIKEHSYALLDLLFYKTHWIAHSVYLSELPERKTAKRYLLLKDTLYFTYKQFRKSFGGCYQRTLVTFWCRSTCNCKRHKWLFLLIFMFVLTLYCQEHLFGMQMWHCDRQI